ncbi:MAG TPA: vWA domain-containing protein [Polyangiaceae bacterium]|nr:vWA domain-containing protein [Polyangiaceae bacterium]
MHRKNLVVTLLSLAALACSPSGGGASPSPTGTSTTPIPGAGAAPNVAPAATDTSMPVFNLGSSVSSNFAGCATSGAMASLLPANILFIIDRSGSMNCNLPPITSSADCEMTAAKKDPSSPSKWEVVRDALKQAITSLPATSSAGITYFSNDNMCGVQSKPNVDLAKLTQAQVDSLTASIDAVKPNGGTPIVGALMNAYKRLNPNQYPDQPLGNKYVVLLTDGQESCSPDAVSDLVNVEAPKAVSAYIKTFVVGVPGSEANRAVLSQLAFNAGTASSPTCDHSGSAPDVGDCHFDMTKEADLATALGKTLASISGQALSCELDVPDTSGTDPSKVNVQYTPTKDGMPVQIVQDPSRPCDGGADGWQYEDGGKKIIVCGPSCDAVRGAYRIDLVLGCATVVR